MSPLRAKTPPTFEHKLLRYEQARAAMSGLTLIAVLAALLILIGLMLRADADRATIGATADRVLSCTDTGVPEAGVPPARWAHPPGHCYAEGIARQADIIGEPPGGINTVVVAAAACARAVVEDRDSVAVAQAKTLSCTRAALQH